ncbi:hypothetical protein H0H87_011721 [Tephrocybe sp. NHM501043]|nr:hypothetical protein H0H87_011721 [Tephrocybe sp. NHM501043]
MYDAQPILETHEVDKGAISIGSIPSLPIIITASVVFFAVDATLTLLRRHKQESESESGAIAVPAPAPAQHDEAGPSRMLGQPQRSLKTFVDKSRTILADVQTLEKQLADGKARRTRRTTFKRRRHDRRLPTLPDSQTHHPSSSSSSSSSSYAFSAFCERLLLTNKIWKQEKALKSLRAASTAKARAAKETAFSTFCEQLLLWNKIWKLEREVADVVRDKERIQRERAAAVTRAAKRMVQDVQKERMVEEFVRGLIEEMGAAKTALGNLQVQHEKEVKEVHEDWVKDFRRVTQELRQLKLAQTARRVEQEVSNSLEESLFVSLQERSRRVETLEESLKGIGYASSDEATLNDADASETESELLSELSTSSTCVSSNGGSRRHSLTVFDRLHERKRCASHGAPAPQKQQHTRSFSVPAPITDGARSEEAKSSVSAVCKNVTTAVTAATRTCNHSGKPLAIRNRTTSVTISRTPPTSPFGTTFAKSGGLANRAPWRV